MIEVVDKAIDDSMDIYYCSRCKSRFALWILRPAREGETPQPGYIEKVLFVEPEYCPNCGQDKS